MACPAAQTPLYVRPPPPRSPHHGPGSARRPSQAQSVDLPGLFVARNGGAATGGWSWRGRDFRSLRLSVRTPPFHGGESGSIPLGSAIILIFQQGFRPASQHGQPTGSPPAFRRQFQIFSIAGKRKGTVSSEGTRNHRAMDRNVRAQLVGTIRENVSSGAGSGPQGVSRDAEQG